MPDSAAWDGMLSRAPLLSACDGEGWDPGTTCTTGLSLSLQLVQALCEPSADLRPRYTTPSSGTAVGRTRRHKGLCLAAVFAQGG